LFLQAYGAAAVIVLIAIVLGRAICSGGGRDQRWHSAPAVGLAALIVLEGAAIKLPGRATSAIVVGGLALVVAGAVLVANRRRAGRPQGLRESRAPERTWWRQIRAWLSDAILIAVPVLGASVPFLATGFIGVPGESVDNDMASHLLWAESLRSARMHRLWAPSPGYPVGPHSVVAALGTLTGSPLDMVFTGLLIAVLPITALVGAGVIWDQPVWRRVLVGVLCSLTYLVAAYYAEAAFKETIMALLLLGFVVHLSQVASRWSEASVSTRWWLVAPAVVLAVGAVYTYSYLGLVWFVASLAVWAALSWLRAPGVILGWFRQRRWKTEALWAGGAAALAIIALLPVLGATLSFFRGYGVSAAGTGAIATSNIGNLFGRLSPYEMFGIWTSPDFRLYPTNIFHAGEFSVLALLVVLYGAVWALRTRRLMLVAAAATCLLIWWYTDRTQSPYVAAKALVIGAPVVMGLSAGGLFAQRVGSRLQNAARLAAAAAFCVLALYSSYDELRHQPVEAPYAGRELASFERQIGDSPVLFLGSDEYGSWQLRPAAVSALTSYEPNVGAASARADKPFAVGQPLDFDSVDPADLDRFRWVITPNGEYASQPYSNFRLVASRSLYELWERTGPTVSRRVIETPGAPGAILNCSSPAGRALRATRGDAAIMTTPVVVQGPGIVGAGTVATIRLPLPAGRWELSVDYISSFNFELSAQGHRWTMPAYLGRGGPYFDVGSVTGAGAGSPVALTLRVPTPSFLTGNLDNLFTYTAEVAATRLPDVRSIVPLSRACGKYVDWYRTT
jgi:hypothetical protein